MIYGHDRTIHRTKYVDVEVDKDGRVVAVWFRCMVLPFEQSDVDYDRAAEMRQAYKGHSPRKILAIEVEDGIDVLTQEEQDQLRGLLGKIEEARGRRIKA